jgi:hypothetical protein
LFLVFSNFPYLSRLGQLCILAWLLAIRVLSLHVLLIKLEDLIVGVNVALSPYAMMLLD